MRIALSLGFALLLSGCGTPAGESAPPTGADKAPVVDAVERQGVLEMIDTTRVDKGRAQVELVEDPGPLAEAAKAIHEGALPDQAIRAATARWAAAEKTQAEGSCFANDNIGELDLPPAVSARDALKLSVIVFKQPRSPHYVACFLVFGAGNDSPSDD